MHASLRISATFTTSRHGIPSNGHLRYVVDETRESVSTEGLSVKRIKMVSSLSCMRVAVTIFNSVLPKGNPIFSEGSKAKNFDEGFFKAKNILRDNAKAVRRLPKEELLFFLQFNFSFQ